MSNDEFYLPSPDEIRSECLTIQASWSESERQSRRRKTPPKIDCDFGVITAQAQFENGRRLAVRRGKLAPSKA